MRLISILQKGRISRVTLTKAITHLKGLVILNLNLLIHRVIPLVLLALM